MNKKIYGHRDSMTDLAQRAESVKMSLNKICKKCLIFRLSNNLIFSELV